MHARRCARLRALLASESTPKLGLHVCFDDYDGNDDARRAARLAGEVSYSTSPRAALDGAISLGRVVETCGSVRRFELLVIVVCTTGGCGAGGRSTGGCGARGRSTGGCGRQAPPATYLRTYLLTYLGSAGDVHAVPLPPHLDRSGCFSRVETGMAHVTVLLYSNPLQRAHTMHMHSPMSMHW